MISVKNADKKKFDFWTNRWKKKRMIRKCSFFGPS